MSFGSYGGGYDNGGMRNDGVTRSGGGLDGTGRQARSFRAMDPEFANNEDALIQKVLAPSMGQSLLNKFTNGMLGMWGISGQPGLVDRPGGGAPVPGMQYGFDPMDSKLAGVMSGALGGVGLKALAKALGASGKTEMAGFSVPGSEIGTKPVAPSEGQGGGRNPGTDMSLLMQLLRSTGAL